MIKSVHVDTKILCSHRCGSERAHEGRVALFLGAGAHSSPEFQLTPFFAFPAGSNFYGGQDDTYFGCCYRAVSLAGNRRHYESPELGLLAVPTADLFFLCFVLLTANLNIMFSKHIFCTTYAGVSLSIYTNGSFPPCFNATEHQLK